MEFAMKLHKTKRNLLYF